MLERNGGNPGVVDRNWLTRVLQFYPELCVRGNQKKRGTPHIHGIPRSL